MSNPKTSRLASALNYLQQIANVRGEATPDDYQQSLGLQGDATPSMSTVTQAARDFGGGVATNLGNRARDIAPVVMETVDPRPLQARPATMKMLGDVASIGKAIVTDPVGTGKLIVSGEADRAKLAMNNPRSMGEYTGSFIDPLRIASALSKRPSIAELDVYHGTTHNFPPTENNPLGEFDASKIGTGYGAQNYGQGIYLSENPSVAENYKFPYRSSWSKPLFDFNVVKYKGKSINDWIDEARKDRTKGNETDNKTLINEATGKITFWESVKNNSNEHPHFVVRRLIDLETDPDLGEKEASKYAKSIELDKFEGIQKPGAMYKADLPDEQIAKMLDWDKPFNQQSPNAQKAIKDALEIISKQTGYSTAEIILNKTGNYGLFDALEKSSVKNLLNIIGEERLQQAGISGIKYLDEDRGIGKGSRNFVVFPSEEKTVRILERK